MPASAFSSELFPTFERPMKATSGTLSAGNDEAVLADATKRGAPPKGLLSGSAREELVVPVIVDRHLVLEAQRADVGVAFVIQRIYTDAPKAGTCIEGFVVEEGTKANRM